MLGVPLVVLRRGLKDVDGAVEADRSCEGRRGRCSPAPRTPAWASPASWIRRADEDAGVAAGGRLHLALELEVRQLRVVEEVAAGSVGDDGARPRSGSCRVPRASSLPTSCRRTWRPSRLWTPPLRDGPGRRPPWSGRGGRGRGRAASYGRTCEWGRGERRQCDVRRGRSANRRRRDADPRTPGRATASTVSRRRAFPRRTPVLRDNCGGSPSRPRRPVPAPSRRN